MKNNAFQELSWNASLFKYEYGFALELVQARYANKDLTWGLLWISMC